MINLKQLKVFDNQHLNVLLYSKNELIDQKRTDQGNNFRWFFASNNDMLAMQLNKVMLRRCKREVFIHTTKILFK